MWPPEALAFLRELEDNNDRDWFRANRARYDAHLVATRPLVQWLGANVGPSTLPRRTR